MGWASALPAAKTAARARSAELSVLTRGKPAAADLRHAETILEAAPATETARGPAADLPDHSVPAGARFDAAQRRWFAHAIVERHVTYSAVGGAIPMPLVNFASMTAVIVRMVKRLSNLYDVPFDRGRARAIVVGLTGGTAHTGFTLVTASALSYVVPAGLIVGVAASSLAAAACTRGIGRIFVEHFERGATLQDFPETGRR